MFNRFQPYVSYDWALPLSSNIELIDLTYVIQSLSIISIVTIKWSICQKKLSWLTLAFDCCGLDLSLQLSVPFVKKKIIEFDWFDRFCSIVVDLMYRMIEWCLCQVILSWLIQHIYVIQSLTIVSKVTLECSICQILI